MPGREAEEEDIEIDEVGCGCGTFFTSKGLFKGMAVEEFIPLAALEIFFCNSLADENSKVDFNC
jgi:hypothetical protein